MSSVNFPIAEVSGNEIISTKGIKSNFYQMEAPDFEQMTDREIDSFFGDVSISLNSTNSDDFFKFYSWDGGIFLNTTSLDFDISGSPLVESRSPLRTFFGEGDLFSDVGIYDDYISFNGKYWRILSALEFSGDEIDHNILANGHDYVLMFKRNSPEVAIKELEKVRNGHQVSFSKNKRDVVSEGAYNQAEDLLDAVTNGIESTFKMELYFVVKGLSLEELNTKTLSLIRKMRLKGMKLMIEGQSLRKIKSGLAYIFNDLIPGVAPKLNLRVHPNKTTHLRYLIPFRESYLMDEGIEFSDIDDNPIYFNPFDKSIKNKNMLVSGSSGSGKSVFVNKLIHHLVDEHPTVILDKDSSFKKTTLYHGGTVMERSLNPMHFKDPAYLKEIVLSCVDKDKFDKLERGRLFNSIKGIIETKPELNSFRELLSLLESDFEGISFYFSEIIYYFDESELSVRDILYVDIENFPKEIISPLIIYVLEYFKSIKKREKVLVFDEAWSFLKDHAGYIDECFRTIRKKGAFLVAIAQGAKDFSNTSGELYNSITNNSYFKLYFNQEHIDDPNVDEFDNSRIKDLLFEKNRFSECYLKTQDNRFRKILRIYLTPLELELFHTESGESEKFYKFLDDNSAYFGTAKESIDAFVRLKYAQ